MTMYKISRTTIEAATRAAFSSGLALNEWVHRTLCVALNVPGSYADHTMIQRVASAVGFTPDEWVQRVLCAALDTTAPVSHSDLAALDVRMVHLRGDVLRLIADQPLLTPTAPPAPGLLDDIFGPPAP